MKLMSDSKLAVYTKISPNSSNPRNHTIDTISIHCMAGNLSVETCLGMSSFQTYDPVNGASCNYAVGSDGRIGLGVEEANRSWCTSSRANDHRAVTIEVANDGGAETGWHVSDKALAALIDLLVDICQRNGIKALLWEGDKSLIGQVDKQNMTVHRWFAAKACPGDYLYSLHGEIAAEVNKRLGVTGETAPAPDVPSVSGAFAVGDTVNFTGSKHYLSSGAVNAKSCKAGPAKVTAAAKSGRHPYHLVAVSGKGGTVHGWVDAADVIAIGGAAAAVNYRVRVTASELNIRKGPGTGYGTNGAIKDKGVYTIVGESAGAGAAKWGKLKSGAGWISLDYVKRV